MTDAGHESPSRIAVIGLAGRFPGCPDVETFFHALREGRDCVTRLTLDELRAAGVPETMLGDPAYVRARGVLDGADCFDAERFGLTAREADELDPQHRIFLQCALTALEHAGHGGRHAEELVGVFAGSGVSSYGEPLTTLRSAADYQRILAREKDFLAPRTAYKLDLRGPAVTVQTACSTSLVAVALACQSLLSYQCDVALAGGVAVNVPLRAGYLHQPGMIWSPDGHCRAFDADAAGTVPADGVGVVVLRRLADALAAGDTIHAVLCGFGISNDGAAKQSFSAPGVEGQAAAIAQALAMADFAPETVSYLEAHGTATPLGDAIELAALSRVFGDRGTPCTLGSLKSNFGHLDAAAGIAGLIKIIQMLRYRELVPTLHVRRPNPQLAATPGFVLGTEHRPWPAGDAGTPRRAGVSSFGMGGTNAHIVLEEAAPRGASGDSRRAQLLVLSAATPQALDSLALALGSYIAQHPEVPLADIAFTLQAGRRPLACRRAIVCTDRADAVTQLRAPEASLADADLTLPDVVFLFPGHGAAFAAMGRELARDWPALRDDLDHGIELLLRTTGLDLRPVLFPPPGRETEADGALRHGPLGQPATFLVEWALSRLLLALGVRPAALLGHSLGEYAAACLAGIFSLADGLRLVAERGALIASTPPGEMLAVSLSAAELTPLLGTELSLAAINGPARCVVAGPPDAVAALERALEVRGVAGRRLGIPHGFHSQLMDPAVAPLVVAAARTRLQPPQLPIVSGTTADWLTAEQACDPHYYGRHLRAPVQFEAALRKLSADAPPLFIEVGPGATLTTLARRHPALGDPLTLTLCRQASGEPGTELLRALAQLWRRGSDLDFSRLHDGEHRCRVPLPPYPFELRRHWLETPPPPPNAAPPVAAPPTDRRDLASWFYRPQWLPAPLDGPVTPTVAQTLIFVEPAHHAELGAALVAKLPDDAVTLVTPGEGFARTAPRRFTLRPDEPADWTALATASAQPERIIYLWSAASRDGGLLPIVRLLRALGSTLSTRPQHLLVVTCEAQPAADASVGNPEQAMLLALPRVVPVEYPNLRCRVVDLTAPALRSPETATQLLHELAQLAQVDAAEPTAVAYRQASRYALRFVPQRVAPDPAARRPALSPHQTCLITGGLGGLGLVFARHLARTAQARLVLVSRSALPPRVLWDEILAADPARDSDSLAGRLHAVRELEQAGSAVLVLSADVSSEPELQRALACARARFGALHGIVHAAGDTSGGTIARQTDAELQAVLAPKLHGARALATLTRAEPLRFFALCSSLTALTGGLGQLAYCAANCFLDAFAGCLRQEGVPAVSIGWDGWAEVGAAARVLRGDPPQSPATAVHPLLGRAIVTTPTLALYHQRLDPDRDWILHEHLLLGRPTLPGTAYIELARAAAAEQLGDVALLVRDLIFLVPLATDPGVPVELWTVVQRSADTLALRVYSRAVGADAPAQLNMQCTAEPLGEPPAAPVALAGLSAACPDEQEPDTLFADRRGVVTLGPRWRCVRRLQQGHRAALAALDAADDPAYALHPALLDMATGCGSSLVPREPGHPGFVPYSYGSIRIRGSLRGPLTSHVRLVDSSLQSCRYAVGIYDPQGAPRVEIDDYFIVAVPSAAAIPSTEVSR